MRATPTANADGTSFHNVCIYTTPRELTAILGEPAHGKSPDGKTNATWVCSTELNETVTIYDWKLFRPIGADEIVCFNIGLKKSINMQIAALEHKFTC